MALAEAATVACGEPDALLHYEPITCPYCWETIEVALDLSVEQQRYVEDCSVCCRPIAIGYRAEDGQLVAIEVVAEGGE
jgi:Cysteine-rich CPXCG